MKNVNLKELRYEPKVILDALKTDSKISAVKINGASQCGGSSSSQWKDIFTRTTEQVRKPNIVNNFKAFRFKKAHNIDEAKAYALEKFGIADFAVDDLSIANMVNRGITRTVNKTNGKAVIPSKVVYLKDTDEDTIAYVLRGKQSLFINKNFFEKGANDCIISSLLKRKTPQSSFSSVIENQFIHSLNRYKRLFDQGKLSKSAKLDFIYLIEHQKSLTEKVRKDHLDEILNIAFKSKDKIKSNNKIYTLSDIGKLSTNEKQRIYNDILESYEKEGKQIVYRGRHTSEFADAESAIVHELGHFAHYKNADTTIETCGGVTQKLFLEIQKKCPNSKMPSCLADFFSEKEQKIARSITPYAASAINEFVAEAYKYAVAGKKLSPEVISMYKKYKGPEVIFA